MHCSLSLIEETHHGHRDLKEHKISYLLIKKRKEKTTQSKKRLRALREGSLQVQGPAGPHQEAFRA